jgi:hypothetical protein
LIAALVCDLGTAVEPEVVCVESLVLKCAQHAFQVIAVDVGDDGNIHSAHRSDGSQHCAHTVVKG